MDLRGLRRIAARLLLDHALQQARDEGHAAGLDCLQIAGREQTIGINGFLQGDEALACMGANTGSAVAKLEQFARGRRESGQVKESLRADRHRSWACGVVHPQASDEHAVEPVGGHKVCREQVWDSRIVRHIDEY